MQNLSQRIQNLAESATIAMSKKAREYKEQGIDIINLSLGEPDFKTPDHIREAAKEAIDSGKYFGYPPVAGYGDLREAIADKLRRDNNLECEAANIVVSTGAKQSIANVMLSLVDDGDEVVVISPYWVTYSEIVKLAGGIPVPVKGELSNEFKPTAEQIDAAITSKTKVMIYSSPSNPTGSVFTREELKEISEVLSKHPQVYVIADEIYEYINFTGDHASLGSFDSMKENTITVNGFSKGFAMTGWRVGFIAAPLWISKACEKMQGQFTSGTNGIAQRAAFAALTTDMTPTFDMAKEYLRRRGIVHELLGDVPGFKNYLPSGAFYFFPEVDHYFGMSDGNATINDSKDFSLYILNDAHVSLVPGAAFGSPKNVRLSYAASESELREAVDRIKASLSKLK